jgi:CheY-like chemotaxis protein
VAKVLVVDDDEVIVRLLELNFELEGHEVVSVLDGQQALDRIGELAPDVVLLDVMMPEVDGYRVCEVLRADPATAALPIVFLSARAQEVDIVRGTEVGGDAYVTKPFEPLELVELVERLVAERRG